jgi:hypothetical protein
MTQDNETITEFRKNVPKESRVGFPRRRKILFDPEMNLQFAVLEPAAATCRETWGLGGFRNSEDSLIELSRIGLSAGGHGEQDMIQSMNAHRSILRRAY